MFQSGQVWGYVVAGKVLAEVHLTAEDLTVQELCRVCLLSGRPLFNQFKC